MNVLIINQHTLNFGDDCAGIALIQNLCKVKEVDKIDILYNTKGKLKLDNKIINHNQELMLKNIGYIEIIKYLLFRKLGYKNIKNKYLNEMLNKIKRADYIFVSPCGANMGIYKDWRFILRLLFVVFENKTPIFHLNTIGKSNNLLFDMISKYILKRSKIYVREEKSRKYIEDLGFDVKKGVDTGYSFENTIYGEQNLNKNVLAFVPTELSWHPSFKENNENLYDDIISTISKFCIKENKIIHLIPHLNSKEEFEFYKKIKKSFILSGIEEANIIIRSDIDDVYKYEKAIKDSFMVVGMRYHSVVLASKNGRPFISLSYENKMQEVCNYTNMQKYSIRLYEKEHNINVLKDFLEEIKINEEKISNNLKECLPKLVSLSKLPLCEISDYKNNEII